MACAICHQRRERRFCPALHERICAVCCGTEREVTLDCPSDCVYLRQAREHEKPRTLEELDQAALFPQVEVREALLYEREPLLVGLSYGLAKVARADRAIRDRDALEAVAQLAATYARRVDSGLVYEPRSANPAQQAIVDELHKMIAEYVELEARHMERTPGGSTLRDSEALQILVFILRMGQMRTSGRPRSRAFLESLQERFPQKQESRIVV
jgi:hypothetical protein